MEDAQLLKLNNRASVQKNFLNIPVLIFDQKMGFDELPGKAWGLHIVSVVGGYGRLS